MAEESDKDQKTEQPSQRRLDEAREKGQIPFSREVTSFFLILLLAIWLGSIVPGMLLHAKILLLPFLRDAEQYEVDVAGVGLILRNASWDSLSLLTLLLIACVMVAIGSSLVQNGVVISSEPIMPKLEKISPMKGFAKLFSMNSLVEFIKGIIKIIIVSTVAFLAVHSQLGHLRQMPDDSLAAILGFLWLLAKRIVIGAAVAMFFIALFDVLYQRFQFVKNLRMSKQELKDEYKQQEGDPKIKQKLRQIRADKARKRMMAAVPGADVVITNPTHYAVALKYEGGAMMAPRVVAKGLDLIALNIRRIAEENDVPIVENPPLARTLYASVEVDEEIPVEHYKAVAEVISYVYKLKGKKIQI